MSTLADPKVRAACRERIQRLDPNASAKWGRMTVHQMVCHLNDSFRVGMGEKYASRHQRPAKDSREMDRSAHAATMAAGSADAS